MAHELAHQYQFQVWDTLMSSPTYASLYGSNIELLANCMTRARNYNGGGHYCTSEQKEWANNIWYGVVNG